MIKDSEKNNINDMREGIENGTGVRSSIPVTTNEKSFPKLLMTAAAGLRAFKPARPPARY
jgi:hypothetical protein